MTTMTPGEEHFAFYHEIGYSITQWAHIENNLFLIAAACVNKRDAKSIAHGFFSIENFRSKLAFVDALVNSKTGISPRRLAEWRALHAQCTLLSTKRNRLAHSRIMGYQTDVGGKRYAILPQIAAQRTSSPKPPPGSLCVRDITGIRYEFFALFVALGNFDCKLRTRPAMLPKAAEQPRDPPTVAEIAAQMRVVLGVPQPPSAKSRGAPGDAAAELERNQPAQT